MGVKNNLPELLNEGIALSQQKNYKKAIDKFKKIVTLDPDFLDAYINWGNTLYLQNSYEKAIEQYKKVVEKNSTSDVAYYNWGLSLAQLQNYDAAIEKFRIATELNPNYAPAYNSWGNALSKLGDHKGALEKFQKATIIDPAYTDAYNDWGRELAKLEKYDEAITRYQKAINIDPDYYFAFYNWGHALANQKKFEEAIEKYKAAANIHPDYADAFYNWGLALADLKKYNEAIEKYQETIQADPDYAEAYNGWGNVLYDQKNYLEAIEKYREAIQIDPEFYFAHFNLGISLINLNKFGEAIEKFRITVNLDPGYVPAYYNWGRALTGLKNYQEAIEKFNKTLSLDPNHSDAYLELGNVLANQFRFGEAIKVFKKAKDVEPDFAYAYHNIAFYLFEQGIYKKGWEAWRVALEVYERTRQEAREKYQADHFYYYGYVLQFYFGELERAKIIYEDGLMIDPDHIGILTGLAALYLEISEQDLNTGNNESKWTGVFKNNNIPSDMGAEAYSEARNNFLKAEKLLANQIKQSDNTESRLQLANLYLTIGEHKKAKNELLEACKLDEDSSTAHADLGVLSMRDENYGEAIGYFEKAVRLAPYNLIIRNNLAEAYLKGKRIEKAEAEYKKIVERTQNNIESHIGLGEVYTAMADAEEPEIYYEAINHYTQGIKIALSDAPSKRLKKKDLAAAYYSRGYARVKLYESSANTADGNLLNEALNDFNKCIKTNPAYHKAIRAKEKLELKMNRFSPQMFLDKAGPWTIFLLSFIVFFLSQFSFYMSDVFTNNGSPGLLNNVLPAQSIDVGMYVLLTFGSLIFMVVGLYLPQVLKLKVGSIELEKSSVNQISTPDLKSTASSLGIRK